MSDAHQHPHDAAEATTFDSEGQLGSVIGVIRRTLRGRYHLALALAGILGVTGALLGFKAALPKYTSTGLVRVAPTLPKVLYENEQNQMPPSFDSFVAGQATLLSSRQILDGALGEPNFIKTGWASGPQGLARLQRSLEVSHRKGEEFIEVTATHKDPIRAQSAVNAVLATYMEYQSDQSGKTRLDTEKSLTERQAALQLETDRLRERIIQASGGFGGTDMLERLYSGKIGELEGVEQKLELLGQLASGSVSKDMVLERANKAGQTGFADSGSQPLPRDPVVTMLSEKAFQIHLEIDSMRPKFSPDHRVMVDLSNRLRAVRRLMSNREQELAEVRAQESRFIEIDPDAPDAAEKIAGLLEKYGAIRDTLASEAKQLGRARMELSALQETLSTKKSQLEEVQTRLEHIRVEASQAESSRITVAAWGDMPVWPSVDKRGAVAGVGGFFGVLGGFAAIVFVGFFDRRCRYIDEAAAIDEDIPVIGALPELGPRSVGGDSRAAFSVHQLRNVLQLEIEDARSHVHCVTSPGSGDGKTSLTLALGASFALAGQKTLIVDADLSRRGMTEELGITQGPGLREATKGVNLESCIRSTSTDNLYAMSAGELEGFGPENLSPSTLARLFRTLRDDFEVIVVDTPPMLGGLEAGLVAILCDRAVLAVTRNRDTELVRASLHRLEQLGATCAGIVFNRALTSDLAASIGCSDYAYVKGEAEQEELAPMSPGVLGRAVSGEPIRRRADEQKAA